MIVQLLMPAGYRNTSPTMMSEYGDTNKGSKDSKRSNLHGVLRRFYHNWVSRDFTINITKRQEILQK